jgi:hypothetical protein
MSTRLGHGKLSVSNPNLDGSGALVDIYAANQGNSLITRVWVIASMSTTAGMIRLFIYDGTTSWLWGELQVAAVNLAAKGTQAWTGDVNPVPPIPLNYGSTLRASTDNAETFNVFALCQDL